MATFELNVHAGGAEGWARVRFDLPSYDRGCPIYRAPGCVMCECCDQLADWSVRILPLSGDAVDPSKLATIWWELSIESHDECPKRCLASGACSHFRIDSLGGMFFDLIQDARGVWRAPQIEWVCGAGHSGQLVVQTQKIPGFSNRPGWWITNLGCTRHPRPLGGTLLPAKALIPTRRE